MKAVKSITQSKAQIPLLGSENMLKQVPVTGENIALFRYLYYSQEFDRKNLMQNVTTEQTLQLTQLLKTKKRIRQPNRSLAATLLRILCRTKLDTHSQLDTHTR
jgi:hypothetical protein